jgi:hypothetical protein
VDSVYTEWTPSDFNFNIVAISWGKKSESQKSSGNVLWSELDVKKGIKVCELFKDATTEAYLVPS